MLDFNEIINNFLLEADPVTSNTQPQWFTDLLATYNKLFKENIDKNFVATKIYPAVVKRTDRGDITAMGINRARILDFLKPLFDKQEEKKKLGDLNLFLAKVDDTDETAKAKIKEIQKYKTSTDWNITYGEVLNAYNGAIEQVNTTSAIALETFNQLSVFNTVQEIVKRRTSVFDRVASLKSPTAPFKNLLQDIFKTPELYLSGQKEITSDWNSIVDNLYITTICEIALDTKKLFLSLIRPPEVVPEPEIAPDGKIKIKTKKTPVDGDVVVVNKGKPNQKEYLYDKGKWISYNETTKTWDVDTKRSASRAFNRLPVNAGLELFAKLVEQVLFEVSTDTSTTTPATTTSSISTPKDYTKDEAAYNKFYLDGILPVDILRGKDESGKPIVYNIKKISELPTPEAQDLITNLRRISHYEKTKPGAGERLAGVSQAAGALASLGGAKLYVGS